MYTYTPNNTELPTLLVRCRCYRYYIQEEMYTCLGCSSFACRYCTSIELHTYYCRNCSYVISESECTKQHRCGKCYGCPSCGHVLSLAKDPKQKKHILMCQFCYWNSKDIGLMDEKAEDLIKMVEKVSRGIKYSEVKAYLGCQKYYKDRVAESYKIKDQSKKRFSHHSTLELKQTSSSRIEYEPIRTTGLLYFYVEEDRKEKPIPKGLPLLSRKTRRCLDCKKLLTKSFKTFRNEHKVELGHSYPKVLMCQKTVPTGYKISMKSLIPMVYTIKGEEPKQLKANELIEVKTSYLPLYFQITVEFEIPNRDKKQINYDMVLRWKC